MKVNDYNINLFSLILAAYWPDLNFTRWSYTIEDLMTWLEHSITLTQIHK